MRTYSAYGTRDDKVVLVRRNLAWAELGELFYTEGSEDKTSMLNELARDGWTIDTIWTEYGISILQIWDETKTFGKPEDQAPDV